MRPLVLTAPGAALLLLHVLLLVVTLLQDTVGGAVFGVVSALVLAPLYARRVH